MGGEIHGENVNPQRVSVPKLQSCLGVRVEKLRPKKIVRVENVQQNVGFEFDLGRYVANHGDFGVTGVTKMLR